MTSAQEFRPRWASPPGESIKDAYEEHGLSPSAFAVSIGLDPSYLPELLAGSEPISIDLARRIVNSIGGSVEFWLARDGQYRDNLSRIEADDWATNFPIVQMASLGWIDRPNDWQSQIEVCFDFFNVNDLQEWRTRYGSILENAKLRTSNKVTSNPSAVAAWLRQAEIEANRIHCAAWNPEEFRKALSEIRRLTRVSDPKRFLPLLQSICSNSGVAVVTVRTPPGCPASGAVWRSTAQVPLIALSARYLSDDHFWFTFFHEAGHLLMHDPTNLFVDEFEKENTRPSSHEEIEADAFATNILMPKSARKELSKGRPTPALLHRLAREGEVSTGILVGQLQYRGNIGFNSVFNKLKKRYRWNGSSLEKA